MYAIQTQQPIRQVPSIFTTNFPLTENPISQGGIWIQQDPNQTKCQTTGGFAFGTQTGSGGFNDSQAYVNFGGPNVKVRGVVFVKSGLASSSLREVEILLRCTDTTVAGSMVGNCYEINVSYDGGYANIGPFFQTALVSLGANNPGDIGFRPATGDVFECTIQTIGGNVHIDCTWNENTISDGTHTLNAVDSSAGKILSGGHGMGFYIEQRVGQAAADDDFRFSSFTITPL